MKNLFIVIALIVAPFTVMAEDGPKLGLNHESELGYVVTGGNSSSETLNFRQNTHYNWGNELLRWTGNYIATKSVVPVDGSIQNQPEAITAENWATALRYERLVSDVFGVYAQAGIAGDRFQGVQERKTGGLGFNYKISNSENFKWNMEVGYEYMRELFTPTPQSGPPHPEYHFVRAASGAEYIHSKAMKLGLDFELLFPFSDQRTSGDDDADYRINFKPYLVSVLSDNFSLKVAYEGRYRNRPVVAGFKNLDFIFSTTLLATY